MNKQTINGMRQLKKELVNLEKQIIPRYKVEAYLRDIKKCYCGGDETNWVIAFLDDAIKGEITVKHVIKKVDEMIVMMNK